MSIKPILKKKSKEENLLSPGLLPSKKNSRPSSAISNSALSISSSRISNSPKLKKAYR
jgi:hypothetical protein